MIILRKPEEKDPLGWYWACEFCGASEDGAAPGGKVDHTKSCPDPTWAKKIAKPKIIAPKWFCTLTLWVYTFMDWHPLPDYYFVSLLYKERRRRKDAM